MIFWYKLEHKCEFSPLSWRTESNLCLWREFSDGWMGAWIQWTAEFSIILIDGWHFQFFNSLFILTPKYMNNAITAYKTDNVLKPSQPLSDFSLYYNHSSVFELILSIQSDDAKDLSIFVWLFTLRHIYVAQKQKHIQACKNLEQGVKILLQLLTHESCRDRGEG